MSIYISVGKSIVLIDKAIEDELEIQMRDRDIIEKMEANREFNNKLNDLKMKVAESSQRVANYYELIDHNRATIGIEKIRTLNGY